MKTLLGLTAILLSTPAMAQSITIENFIGRLEIVEGSSLSVDGEADGTAKLTRRTLIVDGDEDMDNLGCSEMNGRVVIRRGSWIGGKKMGLDTFPSLKITAPRDTALVVRDSLIYGTVSDIADADIGSSSCGDLVFGDVTNSFDVGLSGSLDVRAGRVGEARLRTSGSGDFELDSAESLNFSTSGSGDLTMRSVAGPAVVSTSGSGDAVIGSVGDGLEFRSTGSGDFLAERVDGDVELRLTGSGDVEIDEGNITLLSATTTGSGDVDIGVPVDTVEAHSTGSGDVTVDGERITD